MTPHAPEARLRLLQRAGSLLVLGLLAKCAGLLVQVLTARHLGIDPSLDAYVVSQSIPEMLVQLFMLGALAQMFLPALAEREHAGGEAAAARFSGRVLGLLLLASIGLAVLAGLLAEPLIRAMAPGFDAERHALAVRLFRLMLVNIPFGALIYFGRSLLQLRRRFELAAVATVVSSLAQAAAVALLAPRSGVAGLTAATILMHLAALGVMALGLLPAARFLWPRWPGRDADLDRLVRLAVVVGSFYILSTLSFATDRWFASLLEPGSVAILAYAWRFEPVFLGVIAGAIATPVYTDLSEATARNDPEAFRAAFLRGARLLLLVTIPAAALLAALARPLVRLLFERGAFDAATGDLVAGTLALLAVAFAGWSIGALLVQTLNARQEPRAALAVGLGSTLLNLVLDALLYRPLGVIGLALATTLVTLPMTLLFGALVLRRIGLARSSGLGRFTLGVLVLSLLAAAAAWGAGRLVAGTALLELAAGGAAGALVLVVGVARLRPAEFALLRARLLRLAGRDDPDRGRPGGPS